MTFPAREKVSLQQLLSCSAGNIVEADVLRTGAARRAPHVLAVLQKISTFVVLHERKKQSPVGTKSQSTEFCIRSV